MKSILNEEELDKNIIKIQNYKDQEDMIFDDISDNFININYHYKTNNTEKLEQLQAELVNALTTINKIHNDNIFVLTRNLNKYIETKKEVENLFWNL